MLQANPTPKPRLLILDEDRIILQSLSQFLRREGYDVRTSDTPEDAWAQLEAGHFELLLADINMPGIKPIDFLRDLRRKFPHLVMIVITGFGSIEGAVEGDATTKRDAIRQIAHTDPHVHREENPSRTGSWLYYFDAGSLSIDGERAVVTQP